MASITKRNNSYIIRVSLGRDITGKQLMKNATFTPPPGLTKKQEERAVNEFAFDFEQKARNGLIMDGRQITLKEFCDRWLTEVAPVRLEASTIPKYKRELDDKILPALGHMKLTDIRPHTVSKFYFSLTQDGVRKDKHSGGYSVCTIRKAHAILSSVLTTAEKWELIPSNPCDKAEIPQDRSTEEKLKYFDTEQAIAFLDYLEKPYTVTVAGHSRVDDTGKPYTVGDYEKAAE